MTEHCTTNIKPLPIIGCGLWRVLTWEDRPTKLVLARVLRGTPGDCPYKWVQPGVSPRLSPFWGNLAKHNLGVWSEFWQSSPLLSRQHYQKGHLRWGWADYINKKWLSVYIMGNGWGDLQNITGRTLWPPHNLGGDSFLQVSPMKGRRPNSMWGKFRYSISISWPWMMRLCPLSHSIGEHLIFAYLFFNQRWLER